jgi:plasmid maintenance system antidote protein VapI
LILKELPAGRQTWVRRGGHALRLGRYFGTSPEVWMGMQADYQLRVAQCTIGPEVEKHVHRNVA